VPTRDEIKAIITQDKPVELVTLARSLSAFLRSKGDDKASKTQVRSLFGTLRQIELSWPRDDHSTDPQVVQERKDAYRELVMLGPRLSYQAARHDAITPLAECIQAGIEAVDSQNRSTLRRLVDFFEAVVAYYTADLRA
jgi:CRISPR type III-A-associated protein Csm2